MDMGARRVKVDVQTIRLGEDLLFTVTGGKAHIGATATAGQGKFGWLREVSELPGHKEGELALQLAEQAAQQLNTIVTVVAGIHIPNATKEEIKLAVEDARVQFEEALSRLV